VLADSTIAQGLGSKRTDALRLGVGNALEILAGIHDVRQAGKHRIGEPMAAQTVPNPLDRVELRAVRRQLQ
jgi:hypothetical protein